MVISASPPLLPEQLHERGDARLRQRLPSRQEPAEDGVGVRPGDSEHRHGGGLRGRGRRRDDGRSSLTRRRSNRSTIVFIALVLAEACAFAALFRRRGREQSSPCASESIDGNTAP